MYLSRLQINPRRREARKLLANPRAMHAAVESSFPPIERAETAGRVLWRIDESPHEVLLYVVSPMKPDFAHLQEAAGWETAPGESVPYGKFLNRIARGERFQFRVTVNPVKRLFVHGKRGKIVPHLTEEQQLDWFESREGQWGFRLVKSVLGEKPEAMEPRAARVVKRVDRTFTKNEEQGRRQISHRQVTIVGELVVEDSELLKLALINGMGRGKAYGSGLMTLMKSSGSE